MNHHTRIPIVLLSILILSLAIPAFAVVYVDSNTAGTTHDGTSWKTAYLTIQEGVSDPRASTEGVWVAMGDYNENINITASNVAVYGGFSPGAKDLSLRVPGSSFVTPSTTSTSTFRVSTGTLLDGFTITGGRAALGAAVRLLGSSVIVQNCTFTGNQARFGAGIYATSGYVAVKSSVFEDNIASDATAGGGSAGGAAIYTANGALVVMDSSFANQVASVSCSASTPTAKGGAICAQGGLLRVERSTFTGCSLTGTTCTHYAYGGALYSSGASVYVASCYFIRCSALGTGDTQTSYGGATAFQDPASLNIRNNTFAECAVTPNAGLLTDADRPYGFGAAIYGTGTKTASIINNIIARSRGTAVYIKGLPLTFNYNLLWHNTGGDIYGFNFPNADPSRGLIDGNIMKDPQFRLLSDTDYHITAGSPATNAGTNEGAPSLDIDGENRLPAWDQKVDIGADEFIDSNHDGGADNDPRPAMTDPDGDGVKNPFDNAPNTPNADQTDSNGDGLGDVATNVSVFYVDGSVTLSGNGTSWAKAFKTIQEGINAADTHNSAGWKADPEVWVRGTDKNGKAIIYKENIVVWHGVRVHGGWKGTELPTDADPYASRNVSAQPVGNETIIDGGGVGPVVIIAHLPQDRYITDPATKQAYDLSQPVVDGFTIRNGLGELGGGVSIYKETANVSTCRIEMNTAALGGGVYIYRSTGIVGDGIGPLPGNILNGNTTISNNTAKGAESYAGFGGGVYAEMGSPSIFANIITGNSAFFGGAIAARNSSPIIFRNLIGCRTNFPNAAIGTSTTNGQGGGVYLFLADAVIDQDTIVGNQAKGVNGQGGAVWADRSDFRLKSSIVAYNVAPDGGAIWADSSWPRIYYTCFFANGSAPFFGVGDPFADITNLNANPLFVDPDKGDYHLRSDSPCIKAGFPGENPEQCPPNMGAFQDVDPVVSVGEAKALENGVTVVIPGVIVTAVFPDSIFVEQVDRASGIKVRINNADVCEGQMVDVVGVIATLGGEQQIINARITKLASPASELGPLGMPIKALVESSNGASPISLGLLVRTWGCVKEIIDGASPVVVIEDGRRCVLHIYASADVSLPSVGDMVLVTGVSSVETGSNGEQVRAVRTRRGSDLTCPQR